MLRLPAEPTFTKKFGRRIKAVGGDYDHCRGYVEVRHVAMPWGDEGKSIRKLLQDIVRHYRGSDSERHGNSVSILFIAGEAENDPCEHLVDYPSYEYCGYNIGSSDESVDVWLEQAVQRIEALVHADSRLFWTREEAEAALQEHQREKNEAKQQRRLKKDTEARLIKAFNIAGFETRYSNSLSFDIETSERLIVVLSYMAAEKQE